jgi:hypothetical protein
VRDHRKRHRNAQRYRDLLTQPIDNARRSKITRLSAEE